MLHISIKAEKIFEIAGFPITNSLLAAYIILAAFFVIGALYNERLHLAGSSFVFFIRYITTAVYQLFEPILKEKTAVFFPVLASFFFFILFSNWFGLVPGVESILIKGEHNAVTPLLRGLAADLNFTIALAIIAFIIIQWNGIAYVGLNEYLKKFINFKSPTDFFVGFLETISEFSKIISFAFRLFGNIFAGEVLIAIIAFLIPILASFPFLILEIFVGLVQAMVFAMLTAVFINTATVKEH